jgi:DNA polymerase III delta' subunit
MIFAGPAGVGKATTARALAGLFLCEKPKDLEPCGKCASCKVFDAGNHPDYHVIVRQLIRLSKDDSKARDLAADVIRDFLIAKAAHKSVVGVGKVFVIEEAETMSASAQNSLLKTLEEPAGRTLIILLTDQPDSLLATIRSRCRTVRFAPLDEKTLVQQLTKRGIPREKASEAARFAEGSLGLALRWLEEGIIDRAGELTTRLAGIVAGKSAADLPPWLKAAVEAYAEKQLERDSLASKDQMTREGLVLYLKLAANEFRRRLASPSEDSEALERLCAAIDAVVRAESYVESNVNVPLVLQQFAAALENVLKPAATVSR